MKTVDRWKWMEFGFGGMAEGERRAEVEEIQHKSRKMKYDFNSPLCLLWLALSSNKGAERKTIYLNLDLI